ncbi:hypothetical protein BDK51DRAFT_49052 [Blyttiomyces helicus]|uniref:DUF4097 domain-containing protein n=1 Tax=Blyttiomyces helicus TaxID=388810 RepID=A0A4P9VYC2_9FUNG|nr:hypothetical protein BDK51DRAFT_49052 [Blyttiomyces helicus]|eukprot:RKO84769.1 hypothetical protein BDK51DRAFT_49052 [Blyttiomyces helicus]
MGRLSFFPTGAILILAPVALAQQFGQCSSTPQIVAAPITNSVALAGFSGVTITEVIPTIGGRATRAALTSPYPHTIQIFNNGPGTYVFRNYCHRFLGADRARCFLLHRCGRHDPSRRPLRRDPRLNGHHRHHLNIPNSINSPSCVQTLIRIVYPSTALTLPRLSASSFISNIYLSVDATLASLDLSANASNIISTAPLTVQSTATFASTSGKINTGPSVTADTLLIGSTFGDIAFDNAKFTTANISATAGHVASAYVDVARSLTVGTTAGTVTLAGVDVGAGTALAIGTTAGDVKVTLSAKTYEGGHCGARSGGGASLVVVATVVDVSVDVGQVAPGGRTSSAAEEGAVWFGPENPTGIAFAQRTAGPVSTGQLPGFALRSGSAGRWKLAGSALGHVSAIV